MLVEPGARPRRLKAACWSPALKMTLPGVAVTIDAVKRELASILQLGDDATPAEQSAFRRPFGHKKALGAL